MLLQLDFDGVVAPLGEATAMPPTCYIDPVVFSAEKEFLFQKEWICVARSQQIPNFGDYVCVDVIGHPLVIVRLAGGEVHAMSSVCLHRAMPLCSGQGNTRSGFVCPYHQWRYSLDGALLNAPLMHDVRHFEVSECRLPSVAVEVWQGFVFVNLSLSPVPLLPRLAGLSELLSDYSVAELSIAATFHFDSPWNWKLIVENFMEAYHHLGPHRKSLQQYYPAETSYTVTSDEHLWSALHMPGVEGATWQSLPLICSGQATQLIACIVSPTLIFAVSNTAMYWYQVAPIGHDKVDLSIHVLVQPEALTNKMFSDAVADAAAETRVVHIEDARVCEGSWKGLHSPLARAGRLSSLEEPIWHMNQFWVARVARKVEPDDVCLQRL